jgi:hypothetical protein
LKLSEGGFHPTTLVYFRQRLIEHAKADLAMRAVLEALQKEGLGRSFLKTNIIKPARIAGACCSGSSRWL